MQTPVPPPLVLIVDDDDDVSDALTLVLVSNGYSVERARDGAEACHALATGLRPRAIVLDLMMPVMSGLEFLRCHEQSAHADIPIIVFTACLSNGFAANLAHGAESHSKVPSLSKTASVPEILRALAQATA